VQGRLVGDANGAGLHQSAGVLMKLRVWLSSRRAGVALLVAVVLLVPANAVAKKPPPPPPPPGGGFSTTSTYVKNYADIVNGVELDLTPRAVQATPDGGWVALASSPTVASGVSVAWLLKADAMGAPQWQEAVGCLSNPPGDYSDAVSLEQTGDGGYVLAGGTTGCGSGTVCPSLSGLQCGLIDKLDSTGHLVWARAYSTDVNGTAFDQLRPTSDGGFIAVGSATDASQRPGALIVKLDGAGNIQWQQELGPTATRYAYFNSVEQSADGGYVAAGEYNDGTNTSSGLPLMSILAAKFDASGNLAWQHGFNDVGATGVTAVEHVNTIVQSPDGGYTIGGDWDSDTSGYADECCQGALLVKLTPSGSLDWQRAYSGGVVCDSSYYTPCRNIGGGVYSLHQTSDGGYLLAGDTNPAQYSGLVPWLAKVDGSGALVWQQADYQVYTPTGAPLSEYFASSALTAAGPVALGSTENYLQQRNELLVVQTDANGTVGGCSQIHGATLSATDPALVAIAPGLTIRTSVTTQSASPAQTQNTSATATASQC
jgi:hypothetical protein